MLRVLAMHRDEAYRIDRDDVVPDDLLAAGEISYAGIDELGTVQKDAEALDRHIRAILRHPLVEADLIAEWIDTLTDGYWQRLHLSPGGFDRAAGLSGARDCIARLVPGVYRQGVRRA